MAEPNMLVVLLGFLIVAISANQIAKQFQRIKLPLITGLLVIGALSGPFFLNLITPDSKEALKYVNEMSLAFIAFAAAGELYFKDLRSRINSIKWLTIGQLLITFLIITTALFFITELVPFTSNLNWSSRLSVALLIGTIFCARSPSSVIAVINEVRAKGPFTRSVMGTTVLMDFLVILLFATALSFALALELGGQLNFFFVIIILLDIALSIVLGFLYSLLLKSLLALKIRLSAKSILLLLIGFSAFYVGGFVALLGQKAFGLSLHLEPLLICIVAGYRITNFTRYRQEFLKIIDDIGPYVYCAFFTSVGASLNIPLIYKVLPVALALVALNAGALFAGTAFGAKVSKEPTLNVSLYWMAFLTQAGVGLGLVTTVADAFPEWGQEFSTLVISVIILNQFIGPPLFKWAITKVKESRLKAPVPDFDGIRDAIIFGYESQSIALARQLQLQGWKVKLATRKQNITPEDYPDIDIRTIKGLDLDALKSLDAPLSEAIVLMLTDEENLQLCELIYQNIGTNDVVVRLNHRFNFDSFHKLGALVVDPSTAIVSLLDHFVRSPQATSLLLGMQSGQDTIDLQVLNQDLYGLPLRDLRLPSDTIILSIRRKGQMIISHGYTRLRKGDWITMVGSNESLRKMTLLFDNASN
jgi:Trk K+ transport system NAD-binding subunit/Kef-type K+ transport system membrane component KefB